MELVKKVAHNLYNYLRSFESLEFKAQGLVAFPATAFDQWLVKFENRFKTDPLFLSKGLD